jgi:hypothetical protein
MNVSALFNDSSVLSISQLYGTQSTGTDSTIADAIGADAYSQSDSVDLSKPAQLFSKLQELAKSDPEKFKQVCADIAEKLKAASQETTGRDANMLADLAQKFQNVADGGDISQLQPPPPPSFSQSGGVSAYSQQQDEALIEMMQHRQDDTGSNSQIATLMDSILDEVESALSA